MGSKELPKPIGSFIIDNASGVQLSDGVYYHYTEVIKLLRLYESPQIKENKTEKILRDLKNKYKSWLKEEKVIKLAKTPNYIKEVTLQSKIDLIEEIEKKLCTKR